ncbi:hypothetical protein CDL12_01978 [Handroanthus impetiginosus]|uniref:Uncharacterized protein n=1 Tax=Handroanthus impetiginosus TaxID=429701 RepID=A0A2G9I697_9LAMI|nr:hypothetical protein CDL12_01978 [Handroanthus impetiginosus]
MARVMQPNFSYIRYDIPELKGDNYKMWKGRIFLHLGWMDIDYVITKDEPPVTKSFAGIRGLVDQHDKVCDLFKAIEDQFVSSEKALASTFIMKFSFLRLTYVRGACEHIMQMRDIATQLRNFECGPFKTSYNTYKDKWSTNELMTMCFHEEERLAMDVGESAMLTTQGNDKVQANKKGKGKIPAQTEIKKEPKYHFCKKKGSIKKDWVKFQKWLEKKGNPISCVCYESHMVDVVYNTWWIDSSSTIHISYALHGMRNLRKLVGSEQSIYSRNKMAHMSSLFEHAL